MRTLKIDSKTGDLELDGQNNLFMVDGEDEQLQTLRILFQTNVGEWFLNTVHGLDYSKIQVKQLNETEIRVAFLQAFDQEPRITDVLELEIQFDGTARKSTINFIVKMDGEIVAGEEVL